MYQFVYHTYMGWSTQTIIVAALTNTGRLRPTLPNQGAC